MGENRLFWPQDTLDEWILEDKISLEGHQLIVKSENCTYHVHQALYFHADVGDGKDVHNLLGRVKELATIESMGGEHYMDSVLIDDSAYKVVPGFVGTPVVQEASKQNGHHGKSLSQALMSQSDESDPAVDRELLARFLIENL